LLELELLLACFALGLAAGTVDAMLGGGGLLLTPGMLSLFPEFSMLQIIATQRTSSIAGTSVAAVNYLKHHRVAWRLLLAACAAAALFSWLGVQAAVRLPDAVLKTTVLAVCIPLAIYTAFKPSFGRDELPGRQIWPWALLVGACGGLYNGVIGPGTGVLLLFGFVFATGFRFVQASGLAKSSNLAADLSSWSALFLLGLVQWPAAIPLVLGNFCGGYLGSHIAIKKGDAWLRYGFLLVVTALVGRQLLSLL
jgi:uncharacterized protein